MESRRIKKLILLLLFILLVSCADNNDVIGDCYVSPEPDKVFIKIYENIAKIKASLKWEAVRYKKITNRDHLTDQLYIALTAWSLILPLILYAIARDIKYKTGAKTKKVFWIVPAITRNKNAIVSRFLLLKIVFKKLFKKYVCLIISIGGNYRN